MNYTKSKDRPFYNDYIKNPKTAGNTFAYPNREPVNYKSHDKHTKDPKDPQKDRKTLKYLNSSVENSK